MWGRRHQVQTAYRYKNHLYDHQSFSLVIDETLMASRLASCLLGTRLYGFVQAISHKGFFVDCRTNVLRSWTCHSLSARRGVRLAVVDPFLAKQRSTRRKTNARVTTRLCKLHSAIGVGIIRKTRIGYTRSFNVKYSSVRTHRLTSWLLNDPIISHFYYNFKSWSPMNANNAV